MYAPTIGYRGGGGRGRLPTFCVHVRLVNHVCTYVCPHHSPQGGIPWGGAGEAWHSLSSWKLGWRDNHVFKCFLLHSCLQLNSFLVDASTIVQQVQGDNCTWGRHLVSRLRCLGTSGQRTWRALGLPERSNLGGGSGGELCPSGSCSPRFDRWLDPEHWERRERRPWSCCSWPAACWRITVWGACSEPSTSSTTTSTSAQEGGSQWGEWRRDWGWRRRKRQPRDTSCIGVCQKFANTSEEEIKITKEDPWIISARARKPQTSSTRTRKEGEEDKR